MTQTPHCLHQKRLQTPKQMLQRSPIAIAQVKARNTSDNLLKEVRQIAHSLYRSKEITKKVYSNINQYKYKMDTIFMNLENSKTSKAHVLILNLADKIDLQRSEISIALSNLSIYYTWKNIKSSNVNNKFKISAPRWNDKFVLPDESYSVSDIQEYFEYILKNMKKRLIILQ